MTRIIETRESILCQLSDSEDAAAQLIQGISHAQANWNPDGGTAWSIRQGLVHLKMVNQIYTQALNEALSSCVPSSRRATAEIVPGRIASWFVALLEPPVRWRIKTLARTTPGAEGDVREALDGFLKSHVAVRKLLQSWDSVDLNRVRYRNPFAPVLRFSVGTGLLVINAHDRRHLWQARRVKQEPGYPTA